MIHFTQKMIIFEPIRDQLRDRSHMKVVDLKGASATQIFILTNETGQTSLTVCLIAAIGLLSEKWLCLRVRTLSETSGSQCYSIFTQL